VSTAQVDLLVVKHHEVNSKWVSSSFTRLVYALDSLGPKPDAFVRLAAESNFSAGWIYDPFGRRGSDEKRVF
jgi:hypothetical protein